MFTMLQSMKVLSCCRMDDIPSHVRELVHSIKEILGPRTNFGLDSSAVEKIKLLIKADCDKLHEGIALLCEHGTHGIEVQNTLWDILCMFYQSRDKDLQRFCLQFIPVFVYVMLNAYALGYSKSYSALKAVLTSMYNVSISDEKAKPKTQSFRVLPLNHPSYYHEPFGLGPSPGLTETTLKKLDQSSPKLVTWGPHDHIETLTVSNFPALSAVLLRLFNQNLGLYTQKVLQHTCKIIQRVASQGFVHQSTPDDAFEPRLPFYPEISVEFVKTVYFASFNPGRSPGDAELTRAATLSLEALHSRALRDLHCDLIMMTTAARHSIPRSRESGNVAPSMFNISNKMIITNASFRTKKHAEDIPIQEPSETKDRALSSISEDGEEIKRAKETGPRASLKDAKEKFKIPEINLKKKADSSKRIEEVKIKKTDTKKTGGKSDDYELIERRKENGFSDKSNRKSGEFSSLTNGNA